MNNTVRFSDEDLKVGDLARVFYGGKWHYGRVTGFEKPVASGTVFVYALARVSCLDFPVHCDLIAKVVR
jgi:hypothetical protein